MRMKPSRLILPAALLVSGLIMASPSPAKAEFLIHQLREIPSTATDWSLTVADDPVTHTPSAFTQFDPAWGKLEAVVVTVSWWYYSQINLTFTTPSTLSLTTVGALQLNSPDNKPLLTQYPLFTHTETHTQSSMIGPESATFLQYPPGFIQAAPIVLTSAADLAPFIGTGTVNLPIGTRAVTSFATGSGNGFGQSTTFVSALISLEYVYVPEPSSLLLGIIGTGLILARPFRRGFRIARADV